MQSCASLNNLREEKRREEKRREEKRREEKRLALSFIVRAQIIQT